MCTKNHWTAPFKWLNYTAYEAELRKKKRERTVKTRKTLRKLLAKVSIHPGLYCIQFSHWPFPGVTHLLQRKTENLCNSAKRKENLKPSIGKLAVQHNLLYKITGLCNVWCDVREPTPLGETFPEDILNYYYIPVILGGLQPPPPLFHYIIVPY